MALGGSKPINAMEVYHVKTRVAQASIPPVHPSLAASFVPLPSDPDIPLTSEQLQATFPNAEAWKDMISIVIKKNSTELPVEQQADAVGGEQLQVPGGDLAQLVVEYNDQSTPLVVALDLSGMERIPE